MNPAICERKNGMTRDEWDELSKHMKLSFPKAKTFMETTEEKNLWYGLAMDMDFKQAKQAAWRIIKTSIYPPSIAEFQASYDYITHENQRKNRELKEIYKAMESYYPVYLRDEHRLEAFRNALKSHPDKDPMEYARWLGKRVIRAVQDAERGKTDSLPPLSECIRSVADEL